MLTQQKIFLSSSVAPRQGEGVSYHQFNFKDWYKVSEEPSEWEDYGTWTIKDTNITLVWDDDDPETYKISISGKSLTIYNLEDNDDLTFTKQ